MLDTPLRNANTAYAARPVFSLHAPILYRIRASRQAKGIGSPNAATSTPLRPALDEALLDQGAAEFIQQRNRRHQAVIDRLDLRLRRRFAGAGTA